APQGRGFVFQRDLYGESQASTQGNVRKVEQDQWLLAFHENRFTGELGSELELMATLESTRDRIVPAKGTLQQIKPKMVLFSIKAKGGKDSGATGLRFGPLARFRAPAWGITVAGWPRTLAAEAEAWWTDQELLPSVELHRDQRHFTNPLEIAHRAIQTSVIE